MDDLLQQSEDMIARLALITLSFIAPAANCQPLTLSCVGAFASDASESSLKRHFGSANVRSEAIGVGEGFTEPGNVLFPNDKTLRLEILWTDAKRKRSPSTVTAIGTRWQTPEGIKRGMKLRTVEKYNGRPFGLWGFDWDYGGRLATWKGGKLEAAADGPCRLILDFATEDRTDEAYRRLVETVDGDSEFSSGHPSMQKINPTVSGISYSYLQ